MCYSAQKTSLCLHLFSKKNIQDVINKLGSLDGIKTATQKLKKSLLSFEFELTDQVFDGEKLKEAWESKPMPGETFLLNLFNIKRSNLIPDIETSLEL